jgi:hypothetical protein
MHEDAIREAVATLLERARQRADDELAAHLLLGPEAPGVLARRLEDNLVAALASQMALFALLEAHSVDACSHYFRLLDDLAHVGKPLRQALTSHVRVLKRNADHNRYHARRGRR